MCDAFSFKHQDEYERQGIFRARQIDLEDEIHTFNTRCLAMRNADDLTKTVLFTEGLVDGKVVREVQHLHPKTLSEGKHAARTAVQGKRSTSSGCATGNGELRQMTHQLVPTSR